MLRGAAAKTIFSAARPCMCSLNNLIYGYTTIHDADAVAPLSVRDSIVARRRADCTSMGRFFGVYCLTSGKTGGGAWNIA